MHHVASFVKQVWLLLQGHAVGDAGALDSDDLGDSAENVEKRAHLCAAASALG